MARGLMRTSSVTPDVRIGIVASSLEACQTLRACVEATRLADVALEVEQHDVDQGENALRSLQQQAPDIVLLDVVGLTGEFDSIRRLRVALAESWVFVSSDKDDSKFIIDAMRAGAREFLPHPLEMRVLAEAIQRFRAERDSKNAPGILGDLLCVIGAKGGIGATSLAINLGASLAELPNESVALIDLNRPLGDLAVNLNLKPQHSMTEALASASRIDTVLLESFMCRAYGMAVLSGKREFVDEEVRDPDSLRRMMEVIRQSYTHVVADLLADPQASGFKTLVADASALILPVTPDLPAIWRTKRLLSGLRMLKVSDKVKLVLMRWQRTDEITPEDVESALDKPVFWKIPHNYTASMRAINAGRPSARLSRSNLTKSYREFAAALTGRPAPARRKLGFLGL